MSSAYQATPGTGESSPNGDQESGVREGRRAPFKQLPDAVMDDDTLRPLAKAIYWYLIVAADQVYRSTVTVTTIAAKMRTSERTVRDCLIELATSGWWQHVDRSGDTR